MMKKRILLSLVALVMAIGAGAQIVNVYKNGVLVDAYAGSDSHKYKVVFKGQQIAGHPFVVIDGVKWATMNVGATTVAGNSDSAYGDYYAWGETDTYYGSIMGSTIIFKNSDTAHVPGAKTAYDWTNYCGSSSFEEWTPAPYGSGIVLADEYDVARAKWGGTWRMPTVADYENLIKACSSSSTILEATSSITEGGIYWVPKNTTVDGVKYGVAGMLFVTIADVDKRIFFPAARTIKNEDFNNDEQCCYWTSSLYLTDKAHIAQFSKNIVPTLPTFNRFMGCPVRPVSD